MKMRRVKRFAVWFVLALLVASVVGWITGDYGGAGELVGAGLVVVMGWWANLQRRIRKAATRRIEERELKAGGPT